MLKFDTPLRTRMAPSPTGPAHIGFTRTAYLNYLLARSTGGTFLFRIDDTDAARSAKEFESNILSTMEWLGLEYDSTFRQSERAERYREVVDDMLKSGTAEVREGVTYLNAPAPDKWTDIIAGDIVTTEKDRESVQNLALLRADGSPLYNFCSVVDDIDTDINLVCRGTDHISNTVKQVAIYQALGAELPKFAHVGLIFHQGKKISKRDNVSNMEYYKENFRPETVLNAVLKLGWSHPSPTIDKERPLINKQTAVEIFCEGHLKSAKSTLDVNKLNWLEKKYAVCV